MYIFKKNMLCLYSAQCKWVHPFEKYNFKQYLNEHKNISKMLTRLSLI